MRWASDIHSDTPARTHDLVHGRNIVTMIETADRVAAMGRVVFLRSDLLAEGVSDKVIRSALRRRDWVRVRRGAYALTSVWESLDEVERHIATACAVVRKARTAVVLSHLTAAAIHGADMWDGDFSDVHLTRLDRKAGRAEAGVRQHRGRLRRKDIVAVGGLAVTAPTRTALDVSTTMDVEHALVVADSLCQKQLTTPEAMRRRYANMRHWPETLATELLLRLVDPAKQSAGETRSGYLIWKQGLPAPVCQYPIRDLAGRVFATVDFAWPEYGVYLEFDGKVKYSALLRDGETPADAVFREKKREDRIRELTGWICIRITWADLFDPIGTAARIRRILEANLPDNVA
jgi:hypothetical protein